MANYDVEITLSAGGKSVTLPVNPEVLAVSIPGANETADVVGLGQIVVKRRPNLKTLSLESFFYDSDDMEFLKNSFYKKRTLRMVVTGIEFESMRVAIQNLPHETRAGEEGEIYYTLDLIEYRPYGATLLQIAPSGNATPPEGNRPNESKPSTPSTHTVKSGESPWSITQKYTGDGSRYQEFLNENRALWSRQNNMIHPGNVVSLPSGW